MGFNLFKKQNKDEDNFDQIISGPPALDFPQKPGEDIVPEPPAKEDFILKNEKTAPSAPEFPRLNAIEDSINRPKKMELPKIESKDDLPEFPDEPYSNSGKDAPLPPSYFSKIGNVRQEMKNDYIENDAELADARKPIFVEVDDYKRLRRTISSIEKDAKKSKEIASYLKEMKEKKEKKLNGWDKQLENIQRNMIFADKMLFEEGGPNV